MPDDKFVREGHETDDFTSWFLETAKGNKLFAGDWQSVSTLPGQAEQSIVYTLAKQTGMHPIEVASLIASMGTDPQTFVTGGANDTPEQLGERLIRALEGGGPGAVPGERSVGQDFVFRGVQAAIANGSMTEADVSDTVIQALGLDQEGVEDPWGGGYPGATGTGGEAGGTQDFPPGAYFDYLSRGEFPETYMPSSGWDLQAFLTGGPDAFPEKWEGYQGYAGRRDFPQTYSGGEYEKFMSKLALPLQNLGGGFWDAYARGADPATFMPGSAFTTLGRAGLSPALTLPGEFWNFMGDMWPQNFAPGASAPPNVFGPLFGGAPNPNMASFLMNAMTGDPTIPLLAAQAMTQMQQESAMPFLSMLLGPAAGLQSMFGGGGVSPEGEQGAGPGGGPGEEPFIPVYTDEDKAARDQGQESFPNLWNFMMGEMNFA